MARTPDEKLQKLLNAGKTKQERLDKCKSSLENAKKRKRDLQREIDTNNNKIHAAELECLGDVLRKNGIAYDVVMSAVKRGEFGNKDNSPVSEKPENLNISQQIPEKVEDNENCAQLSTESEVKTDE